MIRFVSRHRVLFAFLLTSALVALTSPSAVANFRRPKVQVISPLKSSLQLAAKSASPQTTKLVALLAPDVEGSIHSLELLSRTNLDLDVWTILQRTRVERRVGKRRIVANVQPADLETAAPAIDAIRATNEPKVFLGFANVDLPLLAEICDHQSVVQLDRAMLGHDLAGVRAATCIARWSDVVATLRPQDGMDAITKLGLSRMLIVSDRGVFGYLEGHWIDVPAACDARPMHSAIFAVRLAENLLPGADPVVAIRTAIDETAALVVTGRLPTTVERTAAETAGRWPTAMPTPVAPPRHRPGLVRILIAAILLWFLALSVG